MANNIPEVRFEGFSGEWEESKLEDLVISIEYGLNASAKIYDGENKYIRITDIDESSHEFIQDALTSPDINFENTNDYLLEEGDILFARTGASVGKTYCYNKQDGKVYYAGFLIRARLKKHYDSNFIFQNTLTNKYKKFIKITSQRSGQPGVNAQEYGSFQLVIPKTVEQTKIGDFFKQLDDTIALQQQELDTLKQTKQGFLQKMFPKEGETVPEVRFPGFSGEWGQTTLGKVFNQTVEYVNPSKSNLELWSVTVQNGLTPKTERYNRDALVKKTDKFKAVHSGEIVYNPMNITIGAVGFNTLGKSVAVSGYYVTMSMNEGFSNNYFGTWLTSPDAIKKYKLYATGSLIEKQRVQFPTLSSIKVRIPSIEEQTKIGSFFKQLDDTIALHQQELDALKETKKAFLQKMFV